MSPPPIAPDDVFSPHAQALLRAGLAVAMAELVRARCVEGRLILHGPLGEVLGMLVLVNGEGHTRGACRALDTLSVP